MWADDSERADLRTSGGSGGFYSGHHKENGDDYVVIDLEMYRLEPAPVPKKTAKMPNPRVYYFLVDAETGTGSGPGTVMLLDDLIKKFDADDGWGEEWNEEDMRDDLAGTGWYPGCHNDDGWYVVIDLDYFQLEPTSSKQVEFTE